MRNSKIGAETKAASKDRKMGQDDQPGVEIKRPPKQENERAMLKGASWRQRGQSRRERLTEKSPQSNTPVGCLTLWQNLICRAKGLPPPPPSQERLHPKTLQLLKP